MLQFTTVNARFLIGSAIVTALSMCAMSASQAQSRLDRDGVTAIIEGTGETGKNKVPARAAERQNKTAIDEPPMKVGAPAESSGAKPGGMLQKFTGVWVEGPGFDVTYGTTYERCAERCLGHTKCVMIEYYLPERKCNLYNTARPRLKGGSSIVGVRS